MTYIVAGSSGQQLAEDLSAATGHHLIAIERKTFSDGETYFRITEETDVERGVVIVQSTFSPQEFHLFELLNLAGEFRRRGHKQITAVVPYLCYARADREVREGDVVSVRTVLELVSSVGISKLICVDIHNPEVINYAPDSLEVVNLIPAKVFADYFSSRYSIDEDWEVMAPDKGALFRAQELAKCLGIGHSYLHKERDPVTGGVSYSTDPEFVSKANVILIDDITSGGSTLKKSAEILRYHGASVVHVAVSHLMSTAAIDAIREISGGELVATESVPSPASVIKLTPLIVEEI